jgi:hypothetical protein
MAGSPKIPHDSFSEGFKVGYLAINGTNTMLPLTPLAPLTSLGMTPFLEGVRASLEAAGIELDQ